MPASPVMSAHDASPWLARDHRSSQLGQLVLTTHEGGVREARPHRSDGLHPELVDLLAAEDRREQRLGLGPGVGSELLDERRSEVLVGAERLALLAEPVVGKDDRPVGLLVERVRVDGALRHGQRRPVVAEGGVGLRTGPPRPRCSR